MFNRIFFDVNFKFLFSLFISFEILSLNGMLKISKNDLTFCKLFFHRKKISNYLFLIKIIIRSPYPYKKTLIFKKNFI